MYTSLKFKLIVALFDQFHLCVKVNISSWLNDFLFKNINFQKSIGYILIVFNFQQQRGVEITLSVLTGTRYDIHLFWKLILKTGPYVMKYSTFFNFRNPFNFFRLSQQFSTRRRCPRYCPIGDARCQV